MEDYDLPINAGRTDYDQMIRLIKDYLKLKRFLQKEGSGLRKQQGRIGIGGISAEIMTPLIGIMIGAACVFFLKSALKPSVQKAFLGFASGAMVAAFVWSLLTPSVDMSGHMSKLIFIPVSTGFLLGIGFLPLLDEIIPHLHIDTEQPEGPKSSWEKSAMLVLAITFHNILEGMAVGVVFAGLLSQNGTITSAGALAPSMGTAIQSLPEGTIISLPFKEAVRKGGASTYGILSGAAESIGAVLMLALAEFLGPVLPCFLFFAAGAMIYAMVEELIPESAEGEYSNVATIGFVVGFVVTVILGVALGQVLKKG